MTEWKKTERKEIYEARKREGKYYIYTQERRNGGREKEIKIDKERESKRESKRERAKTKWQSKCGEPTRSSPASPDTLVISGQETVIRRGGLPVPAPRTLTPDPSSHPCLPRRLKLPSC